MNLHDDPELELLADICAQWTLAFKSRETPRWISMLGKTGTGKTHCGRRLWNYASERCQWKNVACVQSEIYWPKFVSDLRAGNGFNQMTDMMEWPVLFLDDVGAERDMTGFASEQLNTLMGCRSDRWTIITSNLSLSQLGSIDPRISDRMIRQPNLFVELTTKSHSLRMLNPPNP